MTFRALTLAATVCLSAVAAHAGEYSVIFKFGPGDGLGDIEIPDRAIAIDGMLYVTTGFGPQKMAHGQCRYCGALVTVSPDGSASTIHDFIGRADGKSPLVDTRALGTAIGIAAKKDFNPNGQPGQGGMFVFGYDRSGHETTYYSNRPGSHDPNVLTGVSALGGPLVVSSNDGGTCTNGAASHGEIFSVRKDASNVRRDIHTFCDQGDGAYPNGGVISINGVLYGTTLEGGAQGGGTIYSIKPDGTETVLHSLDIVGGYNRNDLVSGLSYISGKLYGFYGLPRQAKLFSMNPAGDDFKVLSHVGNPSDPVNGGLVSLGSKIYGTSLNSLFSIDQNGVLTVEHSFTSDPDGIDLGQTPVVIGGALYGVTSAGGLRESGLVYRFVP